MQIDWWSAGLQAVNFLILVWLLQRFLYKPVMRVIARRQRQAEEARSEAAAAEARADEARRAYEEKRAGLAAERDRLVEEAHKATENERQEILRQARREAEELAEATRAKLAAEREEALADMRAQTAELATDIATHLLQQVGSASLTESFLERVCDYLGALPDDDLAALRAQLGDGSRLRVLTAAALDGEAEQRWRARLRARLGEETPIDFAVEPGLIAGTEVRFPNAVLRFNWRDALGEVQRMLKTDAAAS